MARQAVVQIKCDRCKRVVLQPGTVSANKTEADFTVVFMGKKLLYQDLCDFCKTTIENVWPQIVEWEKQLTQHLLGEQAPPVSPAPDYSPPQPHSAAAGKR